MSPSKLSATVMANLRSQAGPGGGSGAAAVAAAAAAAALGEGEEPGAAAAQAAGLESGLGEGGVGATETDEIDKLLAAIGGCEADEQAAGGGHQW